MQIIENWEDRGRDQKASKMLDRRGYGPDPSGSWGHCPEAPQHFVCKREEVLGSGSFALSKMPLHWAASPLPSGSW